MTRRSGRNVGIAVLAMVACACSVALQIGNDNPQHRIVLAALGGLLFVAAGLVARVRWPTNRTGLLMIMVGFALYAEDIQLSREPIVYSAGLLVTNLSTPLLAWLVLAFPTGRLDSRLTRGVVIGAWLTALLNAAEIPFYDVSFYRPAGSNLLFVSSQPEVVRGLTFLLESLGGLLAVIIVGILVTRLATATPPARRILLPVYAAALVCGGAVIFGTLGERLTGSAVPYQVGVLIFSIAFALLPLCFLLGLLRMRLHRSPVARLASHLGNPANGGLQAGIRAALGDPTLVLGKTPGPPTVVDARQTMTPLVADGTTVGWLVHDPALNEDADLLDGVAVVAALALRGEQLARTASEQLEALSEAAARLADASDAARRQVERDLHDGAQQQLVTAALQLRIAQETLRGQRPTDADPMLDAAATTLDRALDELRALARGIHPAILSEAGIGAALRSLVDRAPVDTELGVGVLPALSGPVESALYFAAAEALTNIAKHADAQHAWVWLHTDGSKLILRVEDDGVGGARITDDNPGGRSGLVGVRDRLRVLGGDLDVRDRAVGGTVVQARLP